jgi:hypothetical protein
MLKNSYGYVIVRWEAKPAQEAGEKAEVTFTVLDAGEGKTERKAGTLKVYGNKIPNKTLEDLGKLVTDAQYNQRHKTSAVEG